MFMLFQGLFTGYLLCFLCMQEELISSYCVKASTSPELVKTQHTWTTNANCKHYNYGLVINGILTIEGLSPRHAIHEVTPPVSDLTRTHRDQSHSGNFVIFLDFYLPAVLIYFRLQKISLNS